MYKSARRSTSLGWGGGGGKGGLLAENLICCSLFETRKLVLALYRELFSKRMLVINDAARSKSSSNLYTKGLVELQP